MDQEIQRNVLSFVFGVATHPQHEVREVSKVALLNHARKHTVLSFQYNETNMRYFGLIVDHGGKIITGGISEAVNRGLVTGNLNEGTSYATFWGLRRRGDLDDHHHDDDEFIYDEFGVYGEEGLIIARDVDGLAILLDQFVEG